MKVLFINTVCGKGSTGRIVCQLAQAVEETGSSCIVAYGRGSAGDCRHSYQIGGRFHAYAHAFLSRLTDRSGFYSRRATKKLVKFIRHYAPDVIHLHNLHGYYLNIEILFDYLKTEFNGKVVWTLHDCWAFTGHCVYYTCAGCDKWKTGCSHCPEKKRYPSSLLADQSRKNYEDKKRIFTGVENMTIVTVSYWLKDQVQQSFLGDYPVTCVYNGIDYNRFRPLTSDIRRDLGMEENKMILSVSDGWDDRKGLSRLLAVAEAAPADWRFVVIGLNKNQIASLPDNCLGKERTWDQEELIRLYTAADVFYNPSMEETFGLVTAEALACGTPAAVMNSTACPEPLCGSGAVLQTDKAEDAIAAISTLLSQGKPKPQQAFPCQNMTAGYLTIFNTQ